MAYEYSLYPVGCCFALLIALFTAKIFLANCFSLFCYISSWFAEKFLFYHGKILNFVKYIFCIYSDGHMVFFGPVFVKYGVSHHFICMW